MIDADVISLSSDSSRPSSPFFDVSDILADTKNSTTTNVEHEHFYIPNEIQSRPEKDSTLCNTSSPSLSADNLSHSKPRRLLHDLSDSDSDESSKIDRLYLFHNEPKPLNKDCGKSISLNAENRFQTAKNSMKMTQNEIENNMVTKGKKMFCKTGAKILTKQERIEEKLRKQREREEKKAEKLAAHEMRKQMQPGNCSKYVTVILDDSLLTFSFGGTLLAAIQNSESKCELATQPVPQSISWIRDLPGSVRKEENDLILIWQWQTVIPAIKNHTLYPQIREIQFNYPNKIVFLIIYGLNAYFSYLKSKKRKASGDGSTAPKKRRNIEENEYPYVTRGEIEEELIELQIMANCNHKLIESSEDLGQFIVQVTKAIAETPFKLDKQRREQENLEWFAAGDSRDCVAVDKNGNGLLRLWQQQLCQFNLASHDTAQAIAAVYPSPTALVQGYEKCSSLKEKEEMLKDIPVRRCQGPLSSTRRIGPELSKKIFTFFCSSVGEKPLSQE